MILYLKCKFCGSKLDADEKCNCTESLSFRLLHYGEILLDHSIQLESGFIRQRLISIQGERYIHLMFNGDVLVCSKIEEGE